MKVYDNGCFFTVSVSRNEIDAFKARWPCSGIVARTVSFQFDKRNGDLVDIQPSTRAVEHSDGPALAALAKDAQAYGRKWFGLPVWAQAVRNIRRISE